MALSDDAVLLNAAAGGSGEGCGACGALADAPLAAADVAAAACDAAGLRTAMPVQPASTGERGAQRGPILAVERSGSMHE